jgi:hypothetical protein
MGCDPRHTSCSSGETTGCGACLDESSMLPTRAASGSLFMAGVDGGGQDLEVAGLGVVLALAGSWTFCNVLVVLSVAALPMAAGRFSFSASRCLAFSTGGAPSMNWKALSFVRVCVEGIIGGPVTTRRSGGAAGLLWWWGKGGAFRWRCHWPLKCCYGCVQNGRSLHDGARPTLALGS